MIYDAGIIGGGVMGCSTALHLAEHGMRVVLLERRNLAAGASGVNAGTLSLQIKRAALIPYALRGRELWAGMSERLGYDVHYRQTGGLTLAFTETEAEILSQRMAERRAAGLAVEIIGTNRAREIEPGLSAGIKLASYCALDGYASSNVTGRAFRAGLMRAGVALHETSPVTAIEPLSQGYRLTIPGGTPDSTIDCRRLVIAGGAWTGGVARQLGVELPVRWRINQVSVTERMRRIVGVSVGHASGLLTLKQSDNGTVLIGGGWQGLGDPESAGEVVPENLIGNLRLARYALPALAEARVVRTWLGYEANVPDFLPLVGALPGLPQAYVIACVRGGYTIGPCMGRLLAQAILGEEPELPLFDPARCVATPAAAAAPAVH